MEGPGVIEYHASNNLYIGNNVTIANDAVVIFRAGNEIIGDPYHNSSPNADITAEIVPCGDNERLMSGNEEGNERNPDNTAMYNYKYYEPDAKETELETVTLIEDAFTANQLEFNIYPNPTNGNFTINLPSETTEADIVVYDATGKVALQKNILNDTSFDVDLSHCSPGLFFVKVTSGDSVKTTKVVYQR
ncbi:MAG: T9SS type A sorting domain-containing protein [Bacteroidetes bacterium]|nr:T9SS type A sorting domain-containing protein [Bacteroidota bacterium]HET6245071.1 T9SS type A sorting domain-containing protein [Bacteroidia bacterium]